MSKVKKQNIGTINALTRITLGLFFMTYGAIKIGRKPWKQGYWVLILCSAMKVGEGIVRYCPVTDVVKTKVANTIFGSIGSNRSNEEQQHE
ncbi:YgaP family membrane protein [Bacillaceae bacterium W0354]